MGDDDAMPDPMQDNKELHDAWHLFFKEIEECEKYINLGPSKPQEGL